MKTKLCTGIAVLILAGVAGGCSSHLVVTERSDVTNKATSDTHACRNQASTQDGPSPSPIILPGLPLPVAIPYVEFYAQTASSKPGGCTKVIRYRHVVLPSGGNERYVNVEARAFSENSLTVKYNERGVVSDVAYGTKPSADMAGAATTAAATLLPFLGVIAAQGDSGSTAGDTTETTAKVVSMIKQMDGLDESLKADLIATAVVPPACDAGEVLLRIEPRTLELNYANIARELKGILPDL